MKKAIMTKWVAALRSGKYKQGQDRLKSADGGFCCLGVLCDISKKGKWNENNCFVDGTETVARGPAETMCPPSIQDWAGLKSENGAEISVGGKGTFLDILNDAPRSRGGKSFKEIARIIEKNYKEL